MKYNLFQIFKEFNNQRISFSHYLKNEYFDCLCFVSDNNQALRYYLSSKENKNVDYVKMFEDEYELLKKVMLNRGTSFTVSHFMNDNIIQNNKDIIKALQKEATERD